MLKEVINPGDKLVTAKSAFQGNENHVKWEGLLKKIQKSRWPPPKIIFKTEFIIVVYSI